MRKVKFAMMILAASLLTACGSSKKEQSVNEETAAARTQETENLLANLKKIPSKGIMLGHHDDTVYGISLLYTTPSPRDGAPSRKPSSA